MRILSTMLRPPLSINQLHGLALPAGAFLLLADAGSGPPADFDGWLRNLAFFIICVGGAIHTINQAAALIQKVRGKAIDSYGQKLATQQDISDAVQPVTDGLTKHAADDSKQFREIKDELKENREETRKLREAMLRQTEALSWAIPELRRRAARFQSGEVGGEPEGQ